MKALVKALAVALLTIFGLAYLGLCAYGIAKTGSTAGLADIGKVPALAIVIGAIAAVISPRE